MFWGYGRKRAKNNDTSVSIVKMEPAVKVGGKDAAPPAPAECEVPPGIELPGLAFAKLAITDPLTELTAKDLSLVDGPFRPDRKLVCFFHTFHLCSLLFDVFCFDLFCSVFVCTRFNLRSRVLTHT